MFPTLCGRHHLCCPTFPSTLPTAPERPECRWGTLGGRSCPGPVLVGGRCRGAPAVGCKPWLTRGEFCLELNPTLRVGTGQAREAGSGSGWWAQQQAFAASVPGRPAPPRQPGAGQRGPPSSRGRVSVTWLGVLGGSRVRARAAAECLGRPYWRASGAPRRPPAVRGDRHKGGGGPGRPACWGREPPARVGSSGPSAGLAWAGRAPAGGARGGEASASPGRARRRRLGPAEPPLCQLRGDGRGALLSGRWFQFGATGDFD